MSNDFSEQLEDGIKVFEDIIKQYKKIKRNFGKI